MSSHATQHLFACQVIRKPSMGVNSDMKKLILAVFAALFTAAPATANPPLPEDIVFDVLRNGSEFGEHIVRFERDGDLLRARTEIELQVRIGPFTVFRYEHAADEAWQDNQLLSISARTFKDGEWSRFDYDRSQSDLLPVLDAYLPSTHWRAYDTATQAILNTETGEPLDVVITELGWETFETAGGPIEARRLRMVSDLTVDLWYDAQGNWVGCEFEARGQTVRYIRR